MLKNIFFKIMADENQSQKLNSLKSKTEMYDLFCENGYTKSFDEFEKEIEVFLNSEDMQKIINSDFDELSDEMLEMREEIYAKAAEHPVFEFATGVSKDISNITDGIIKKSMHPSDPGGWSQTVEENKNGLDYLIEEAQTKIE